MLIQELGSALQQKVKKNKEDMSHLCNHAFMLLFHFSKQS